MIETFSYSSKFGRRFLSLLQHYDHKKYWNRRAIVVDSGNKTNILLKLYFLYYIKKIDAMHHCSFGTNLNSGTFFASPPILPYGPNGIIVGHDLFIGKQCIIYQHVTICHGKSRIGNNVILGAGAVVLPGCIVGNNVKVGANCVVVENVPDNATIVLPRPRIILK